MKKSILGSIFIFYIFGCTTLQDIRSFGPEYSATSLNEPKEISNCITHKCQNNLSGLHITQTENQGIYYISISTVGFLGVVPMDEITVKPNGNGSVVELRSNHEIVKYLPNKLIEIVNNCASPRTPQESMSGK